MNDADKNEILDKLHSFEKALEELNIVLVKHGIEGVGCISIPRAKEDLKSIGVET